MTTIKLFRVQHPYDGRGPFRPGFSHRWLDAAGDAMREHKPTLMSEFGADFVDQSKDGEHLGTGVRTMNALCDWFSLGERRNLAALGFEIVCLPFCRLIQESAHQVFFGRLIPLQQRVIRRRWI